MTTRTFATTVWGPYRWHSRLWNPPQAGNLTAFANGIWPARTGWTPEEVAALLFWRWMYRNGQFRK